MANSEFPRSDFPIALEARSGKSMRNTLISLQFSHPVTQFRIKDNGKNSAGYVHERRRSGNDRLPIPATGAKKNLAHAIASRKVHPLVNQGRGWRTMPRRGHRHDGDRPKTDGATVPRSVAHFLAVVLRNTKEILSFRIICLDKYFSFYKIRPSVRIFSD